MKMDNKDKGKMLSVSLEFLGATDGIVTGSANLVTITRGDTIRKILVDFGCFQGEHEYMNEERFINPDEVDCVILTHAHLDHCGGVPLLFVSDGEMIPFTGKIYGSRETLDQASHILRNAAKLNEERIRGYKSVYEHTKASLAKDKEKATREEAKPKDIAAIDSAVSCIEEEEKSVGYTMEDVDEAIRHFYPIDFCRGRKEIVEQTLFEGIYARFIPTSHINGSTMVEIVATYGSEQYTIVFTGDIGKESTILYRQMKFHPNTSANAIVMESLHGTDEPIETLSESISLLKKIIRRAVKKQKTVIIPTFALDRSAGLIKILNDFMDQGMYLQCFFDSSLAETELRCYINSYLGETSAWFNYDQGYPFKLERFKIITNYQDHMLAAKYTGPNIFITASGMGFGGRVIDYFEHHIQSEDSIFVFPGFLTEGCPSRILLEANQGDMVEINGRRYIKHCETIQLHGFSSHGYFGDKLKILLNYPNAKTVFLNHGDDAGIYQLRGTLPMYTRANIIVPEFGDHFVLL